MPETSNEQKATERIAFMKRNCSLCKGRSRLRTAEPERKNVQDGLNNMVEFYREQFNWLRKQDAETGKINKASENKRLCMDLLEECSRCDKEIDRVNRGLNGIRK